MSREHVKSRRNHYSGRQREMARRDILVPREKGPADQNGSAKPLIERPSGKVYRIQLSPGVEFDLPLEDQS